jgi:Sigma-70, region 4
MIGTRVGRLVVVGRDASMGVDYHGGARWRCVCDCGGETIATGSQLRGARARQSCGRCGRSPASRDRAHRSGPRARTLSMSRASTRLLAVGARLYSVEEHASYERPATRGDCLAGGSNAARPCPWVSCAQHLAVDVHEQTGNLKITLPSTDGEPDLDGMRDTCALDVADRGGETLDEVGAGMNLTRERVRQLEVAALRALELDPLTCELADVEHLDSRGEIDHSDDGSGALSTADAVAGLASFSGGGGAWTWVR